MEYTLNIGGEHFQVDGDNKVITQTALYERAYKAISPAEFKASKFLLSHRVSDICFDKPDIKTAIRNALKERIKSIKSQQGSIRVRRLKNMALQRVVKNLGDTLEHIRSAGACPQPGQTAAEAAAAAGKAAQNKLNRIRGIVDVSKSANTNIGKIKNVLKGGAKKSKQSDLTDSSNYLQTVFKFMYVLAHPNKLHAKRDWTKLLERLEELSLEDILKGIQEQHEMNSSNNNSNSLLTDSQIQTRLRSILQLLQTHHVLQDNLNLDEFSSTNAKQNSVVSHRFTNTLDTSLKTKLDKALHPIWKHYKASFPSLYEFVESQESIPLYSLLYLQTKMDTDIGRDKIYRLDDAEFNTKPFKNFLKGFSKDYKSAKPENTLDQDCCLVLEGRNFRIPDNLEEAVELEIIDKLILKEGKRRHYKESLMRFFREFFTKKSVYVVCTKRKDEALNGLELNLQAADLDSKLFDDIREQIPSLTLDRLGITVHQMPTEPVWTDSLNAFCAILAFKKELGSTTDGTAATATTTATTTDATKTTAASDHDESLSP